MVSLFETSVSLYSFWNKIIPNLAVAGNYIREGFYITKA